MKELPKELPEVLVKLEEQLEPKVYEAMKKFYETEGRYFRSGYIKSDEKCFVLACSRAEKACKFILDEKAD